MELKMGGTVRIGTARELVEAGSLRQAAIVGQAGGYAVLLRVGAQERALATKNGEPRLFAGIDAAARLLRDQLGVARFEVDATHFSPTDLLRRRRPDRAKAMRELYDAAEHDRWFRGEVEQALAEADDPATEWVDNDQVKAQSAEHRARWRAQAGGG
jgi:hypothetical protein